jgi:hypothetical protein
VEADPEDWQAREVLGAALYRAGKPGDAVRELDEAVRLYGAGGSVWARGLPSALEPTRSDFRLITLALAHQRLGQADQVNQWRQQVATVSGWEEALIQRQLLRELDAAQRPGSK